MKYGVIDVGSNSVRLMISDGVTTLEKSVITTRLIEGSSISGLLTSEAVERTAQAVSFFVKKAKEKGVCEVFVFATAGVRQSSNPELFIDKVFDECGIKVDVVSGETEAMLGALGALNFDGGVIDVGGASTEIITVKNGEIDYAKSLDFGAVRLTQKFNQNQDEISRFLDENLLKFGAVNSSEFCAVGGTATSIASMLLKLEIYDRDKVHNYQVNKRDLACLVDKIFSMSIEDRKSIVGLQKERAEIIGSGALILLKIMEYLNTSFIRVSESDNLEGYLRYILERR